MKKGEEKRQERGQKQFFSKFVGLDVPLNQLQLRSLAFFQSEVSSGGQRDAEMPAWREKKAYQFVNRIKNGFKGLNIGGSNDLSKFSEEELMQIIAREGAQMLQDKRLADAWALPMHWGPEDGRAHGSMPSPDEIKSGLLHVLSHVQANRRQAPLEPEHTTET